MRRAEDELNRPGMVAYALARCEYAFSQPGRYLDGPQEGEPGEIEVARDDLDEVLGRLPPGARADLGRLVQRIDEELERRTLPNPGPAAEWTAGRWWWWRIRER